MRRAVLALALSLGCRAAPEPSEWEFSGIAKFQGQVPRRKVIHPPGLPGPFESDELVIGVKGGVRWAVVHVTQGLEDRRIEESPPEPVRMDIQGHRFVPHVLAVRTRQAVPFANLDSEIHHIHPTELGDSGFVPPGMREYRRPGFISLRCDIHPWCSGWIAAFDHPFFAVTDEAGRFTIKGLPPGKYTLEVWHERLKGDPVEITVEGKETKVPELVLVPK